MSNYVEILQIIQIEKPDKMSNLTLRIVVKPRKLDYQYIISSTS